LDTRRYVWVLGICAGEVARVVGCLGRRPRTEVQGDAELAADFFGERCVVRYGHVVGRRRRPARSHEIPEVVAISADYAVDLQTAETHVRRRPGGSDGLTQARRGEHARGRAPFGVDRILLGRVVSAAAQVPADQAPGGRARCRKARHEMRVTLGNRWRFVVAAPERRCERRKRECAECPGRGVLQCHEKLPDSRRFSLQGARVSLSHLRGHRAMLPRPAWTPIALTEFTAANTTRELGARSVRTVRALYLCV